MVETFALRALSPSIAMLTPRQSQALRYIIAYQDKRGGVSPSNREVAQALGLWVNPDGHGGSSSVHRMLVELEARGFIRRLRFRDRAIEILKRPVPITFQWKGETYRFISAEELAA